jgi:hypothetical protein
MEKISNTASFFSFSWRFSQSWKWNFDLMVVCLDLEDNEYTSPLSISKDTHQMIKASKIRNVPYYVKAMFIGLYGDIELLLDHEDIIQWLYVILLTGTVLQDPSIESFTRIGCSFTVIL